MEVVISQVQGWSPIEGHAFATGEGLIIPQAIQKKVCKYHGIPETLVNVDQKFGTNTLLQVAKVHEPMKEVKFLVDNDEVISVIDPKSTFITDDQFAEMVGKIESMGFGTPQTDTKNGSIFTKFSLDVDKSDNFLSDIYQREIKLERLPQGGVSLILGLMRLACTNGAVSPDKQFRALARTAIFDDATLANLVSTIGSMDLSEYLHQLWTKNGEYLMASVADFYDMKRCLAEMTTPEDSDLYFPTEPIESHYASQGIDLGRINNSLKTRMPSGVSYVDCFNFLTNGIKLAGQLSLEDEVKVGRFIAPSKIMQLKQSDVNFKGIPFFSPEVLATLKGDRQ